jgi:hypothetical protein
VEQLMALHHKSRIMCVDEFDQLIGVISLSDIAEHEGDERASHTLKQISDREIRLPG